MPSPSVSVLAGSTGQNLLSQPLITLPSALGLFAKIVGQAEYTAQLEVPANSLASRSSFEYTLMSLAVSALLGLAPT